MFRPDPLTPCVARRQRRRAGATLEAPFVERALRKDPLAWLTRVLFVWVACASAGLAFASVPDTHSAASLQAKYASLGERLRYNPFRRALALESTESPDTLRGDIYALVNYPFSTVSSALHDAEDWCDVLILHINTKYCRARTDEGNTVLTVRIGKKTAQPLKDGYPIEFSYRVAAATATYLEIQLNAPEGPLSTRDYRILLQAVPVGNGRTFVHLSYSYEYGLAGRLAMKTYLATIGSARWDSPRSASCPTAGPDTSVACVAWWNATPCAITSPSTPISAHCRPLLPCSSRNACNAGSSPPSNTPANCAK